MPTRADLWNRKLDECRKKLQDAEREGALWAAGLLDAAIAKRWPEVKE